MKNSRSLYFKPYTKYLGRPLYKLARKKLHLPKTLAMAAAHTPTALVHGAVGFALPHIASYLISGEPLGNHTEDYKQVIENLSMGFGIGATALSYAVIVPLQLALHRLGRNQRDHSKSIEDQL